MAKDGQRKLRRLASCLVSILLEKWILDNQIAEALPMLQVLALKSLAIALDGSGHNQRVVPGNSVCLLQSERLQK